MSSAVATDITMYVAGDAPNSVTALANLKAACARHPDHVIRVEVVNVVEDPMRGLRDGVLVTPMLVRTFPLPERRILGNLHNAALLLSVLGAEPSEL